MKNRYLPAGSMLIVVTLVLLSAPVLLAQGMSGEPIWIFDPSLYLKHIETADLNGDGILDVIAGEYSSDYYGEPSRVYAIDGESGDTLWSYILQDGVRSMTIGDINGDGIMDVIAGASYNASGTPDGKVHAINGADGSQLWAFNIGSTIQTVAVGDLNGDTYLDVVAGSFDDRIYAIDGETGTQLWQRLIGSLWINAVATGDVNGDGIDDVAYAHEYLTNFNNFCGVLNGVNGQKIWEDTVTYVVLTVLMADIDNDSQLEAVFGVVYGDDHAEIIVRDASNGDHKWSYNLGPMEHVNGDINLHVYDVDGDGDIDLVVGNYLGSRVIHAFNGDVATPLWVSDTLSSFPTDIAFGDVTGDKELNIVASAFDRVIVLNKNGSQEMWYYSVAGTIAGVAVADFDGDGTLDVAACGGAENTGTPPNPGKGVWALRTVLSPVLWEYDFGQYGNAIAAADLDGDGYDDIIAVCSLDDKAIAISGKTGLPLWDWTGTENLYAVTVGDFDNDGQVDVAVAGNDKQVTALNGANGAVMWQFTTMTAQIYRKCLVAADLNGDGAVDVISGSDDGKVYAINGTNGAQLWSTPVGAAVNEVELAQMNGAGPLDVVVGVGTGTTGKKLVVLDGADGGELWSYLAPEGVEHVEVFDANGDEHPDVAIAVTPFNPRQVIAVDGKTHTQLWSAPVYSGSNTHSLAHGDVNGDGVEDIIVPGSSTDRRVIALDGNDGSILWSYLTGGEVNTVLVYDVDNDGNNEVIAGSDDQILYLFEGATGALLFEYSTADDVMQVLVADISGDGLPNMACVTFGSDGVVYAFRSLATAPSHVCGDADGNEIVTISDAVYLINYIFGGGPAPDPLEAGDVDCNDLVTISDAVYLINYIFGGGPDPCAGCP